MARAEPLTETAPGAETALRVGIDLIEIDRVRRALDRHGDGFRERCFTPAEREYCESKPNPAQHYAGRFAAKEAILKLLGTGWRGKIAWTDIEVTNNSAGRPEVTLSGEVKAIADRMGIKHISISITHTANFAIASAVALTASHEDE